MMRRMGTISALVALLLVLAIPVSAAEVECNLTDQSTQAVLPGVVLTWDSSFHCRNAPVRGEYSITIVVSNAATSTEAVTIDSLILSHTTPRPRGRAPEATAEARGLPITVEPGESESFDVTGTYELVVTDEGKKANLHLLAYGVGDESGEPFQLGINVHIRAPGVAD
jgi:hypothetical protein